MSQAEVVLSGKPDGSFLVMEISGKPSYDTSSSSINTHILSVVWVICECIIHICCYWYLFWSYSINGRVSHLPIFKKGNYYGPLSNVRYSSIESLIAYHSRTGILTRGNLMKLTNQFIPDKWAVCIKCRVNMYVTVCVFLFIISHYLQRHYC